MCWACVLVRVHVCVAETGTARWALRALWALGTRAQRCAPRGAVQRRARNGVEHRGTWRVLWRRHAAEGADRRELALAARVGGRLGEAVARGAVGVGLVEEGELGGGAVEQRDEPRRLEQRRRRLAGLEQLWAPAHRHEARVHLGAQLARRLAIEEAARRQDPVVPPRQLPRRQCCEAAAAAACTAP